MTFTPGIPANGQSLGSSRLQVLNNFANYFNVISVNHVAPNASGEGKHKFVEMPVQASAPATLANEGGIWAKTIAGVSFPVYQRDTNTTVNQPMIPMAIATFITTAAAGPVVATRVMSYNTTSVTKSATGTYNVILSITLPFTAGTSEYGVLMSVQNSTQFITCRVAASPAPTGSTFTILLGNTNGLLLDDAGARVTFAVFQ